MGEKPTDDEIMNQARNQLYAMGANKETPQEQAQTIQNAAEAMQTQGLTLDDIKERIYKAGYNPNDYDLSVLESITPYKEK